MSKGRNSNLESTAENAVGMASWYNEENRGNIQVGAEARRDRDTTRRDSPNHHTEVCNEPQMTETSA